MTASDHGARLCPEVDLRAGDVRGRSVAVSSGHALASAEAVRVFRDGGNVVDAAIAGAAVLGVVLPYACGLGGDAFLLFREARTGKIHGINGTGAAPTGAAPENFAAGIPDKGVTAATVPGAVAAWEDSLRRFGTRSLGGLLGAAIGYARDGFPAHRGFLENRQRKRHVLLQNPEATRLFMVDVAEGEPLRQEELAQSLEAIAESSAREFYQGSIADRIVTETSKIGGLFSPDDFAGHESLWQDPIGVGFYEYQVSTMPPNSVGLRLLLQLLSLEASDVREVEPNSPDFYKLIIRAWRWAHAASTELIGDPEATVPLSVDFLAKTSAAPPSCTAADLPPRSEPASADTSNIAVADAEGNAVSLVQSVSAPFASGVVVPGTGILLNNRMRGFNTVRNSVNCVGPGRKPAHTLVPALVSRHRRPMIMPLGTPGAAGQTITLAQFLSRVLAHGQDIKAAVEAPRCSIGHAGNVIVERTASEEVVRALSEQEPDLDISDVRHERFGSVKVAVSACGATRAAADYRRVAAVCGD